MPGPLTHRQYFPVLVEGLREHHSAMSELRQFHRQGREEMVGYSHEFRTCTEQPYHQGRIASAYTFISWCRASLYVWTLTDTPYSQGMVHLLLRAYHTVQP